MRTTHALLPVLLLLTLAVSATRAIAQDEAAPPVRAGLLTFDGGRTASCFADGFLADAAQATGLDVAPALEPAELGAADLSPFALVVFSGEGGFDLSDAEKASLRQYIDGGGFLLASAGCSDRRWRDSFRALFTELYGDAALEPLSLDHPIFHTVHDIDALATSNPLDDTTLYGYSAGGRLRVLFSPQGLNDTAEAGAMCCCCGGDEIRDASRINANAIAYAVEQP